MTTENHPIDQLFREKLGNLEQNPSLGLMAKINQELVFRSKVRRINQLKTVIGIAATVLLVALAGWFTIIPDKVEKNEISQQIRQENPPVLQNIEKNSAVSKPIQNQLSTNKPLSIKVSSKQSVRKIKAIGTQKNTPAANTSAIDNIHATEPASKVSNESVQVAESSPKKSLKEDKINGVKDEAKSEPKPNTFQKNKEAGYYNNSNFAQNTGTSGSKKGNFSLKAEISPMFASQKQVANSDPNTKALSTVSGGMIASLKLNKRLSVSSGLVYSRLSQQTQNQFVSTASANITSILSASKLGSISSGIQIDPAVVSSVNQIVSANISKSPQNPYSFSDISQQFDYIEIPVIATYKIIDKKISLGLSGGVSTNFLVGNNASVAQNGVSLVNGQTSDLRNMVYSGLAGIALGYDVSKRIIITFEPRVKQYLNSVSNNNQVDFKPVQMGFFTGITYTFE
jgi:cell division septation protein DedD